MKSYSVRYFPFSAGIPWSIRNGLYVEPKISSDTWHSVLADKQPVVVAYGGLFESFWSLSICEAFNIIEPHRRLFWAGNDQFEPLLALNGLAKPFPEHMDPGILLRFPVPLFFDKLNYAYFNCLHNYIKVKSYFLEYRYRDLRASARQIFENSSLDWDIKYLPKLRKFSHEPEEFIKWKNLSKFYVNKPFVLIIPEKTGYSDHRGTCLDWDVNQVKALGAMLHQAGLSLVVCTDKEIKYHDGVSFFVKPRLDLILYLISKASAILSREADFLLLGLAVSKAKIVALPQKFHLNYYKNRKYLNVPNAICVQANMTPKDAFEHILGLRG